MARRTPAACCSQGVGLYDGAKSDGVELAKSKSVTTRDNPQRDAVVKRWWRCAVLGYRCPDQTLLQRR